MIIRKKTDPKRALDDKSLSLAAKGLYCMIRFDDGSKLSAEVFNERFDMKVFRELVSKGYLSNDDIYVEGGEE